ncbi:MAG: hypothetical protein WCC48_04975 [Anaeromyxobacteraceae bacterium]
MRNHARLLAAALALSASGCSLIVDPKAKDPLNTAEGFCNSAQDAFVNLYTRCGIAAEVVEPLVTQWRAGCVNMGASAASGRINYERAIAEQCIAAFDATTVCNESMFETVFSLCALATRGTVQPGGVCYTEPWGFVTECAGGGACDSSTTCPGICVVPGQLDQPCSSLYPACASGLYCVGNATDLTKLCVAPGGYDYTTGQYDACGGPYDPPCDGNYYCNYASTPPRCSPAPSIDGDNCSVERKCTAYNQLTCVPESSTYVCRGPAPLGGDCYYRGCVAGAYCRYEAPSYVCRSIPASPQPVGGDCAYQGLEDCQPGLYCRSTDYTCQAPKASGASCTGSEECGSTWNTCAIVPGTTSGSCVVRRPFGATCRAGYEECQEGLWCEAVDVLATGVCRGLSGEGGKCGAVYAYGGTTYERAECAPNLDCGAAKTCVPYLGAGAACEYDGDCGAPWSGLSCAHVNPAITTYCGATPGDCTCAPNACSLAFGWLAFF